MRKRWKEQRRLPELIREGIAMIDKSMPSGGGE